MTWTDRPSCTGAQASLSRELEMTIKLTFSFFSPFPASSYARLKTGRHCYRVLEAGQGKTRSEKAAQAHFRLLRDFYRLKSAERAILFGGFFL